MIMNPFKRIKRKYNNYRAGNDYKNIEKTIKWLKFQP